MADSDAEPRTLADDRWLAVGVLLVGASIIGLAPILVRLGEAGPAAIGFWRLTFALPILALMAGLGRPLEQGAPPLFNRATMLAGVMFAADLGSWHYGISLTNVANATVLANLTPVVVTLVAWLVFREQPTWRFMACVAVALSGAWFMSVARGGPAPPGVNPPLGDALSASSALWYALYLVSVGRARRSMGPTRVMLASSAVGAPLLLAFALAMHERVLPAAWSGWAACIGLALMHVTGQGSIAWALGRLPTPTASMVVLIQPVVAAILGWLLLREPLGVWQTVGGVVALGGVVTSQLVAPRSPRPEGA